MHTTYIHTYTHTSYHSYKNFDVRKLDMVIFIERDPFGVEVFNDDLYLYACVYVCMYVHTRFH
jgi:hypothetical protein